MRHQVLTLKKKASDASQNHRVTLRQALPAAEELFDFETVRHSWVHAGSPPGKLGVLQPYKATQTNRLLGYF